AAAISTLPSRREAIPAEYRQRPENLGLTRSHRPAATQTSPHRKESTLTKRRRVPCPRQSRRPTAITENGSRPKTSRKSPVARRITFRFIEFKNGRLFDNERNLASKKGLVCGKDVPVAAVIRYGHPGSLK